MQTVLSTRARPARVERRGGVAALLVLLFVVSGATGLVLEILWTRMLVTMLGATTWGVMTVLVAFMGGLGLGSYLWGRHVERTGTPLRQYAMLEIGIGLYTLAVPYLFAAIGRFYVIVARASGGSYARGEAARVAAAILALAVPTVLMGGTLPVLTRALAAERGKPGRAAGILYAANTLGAVFGCLATGFVLILWLGVSTTNTLAALADLGIGATALAASRWASPAPTTAAATAGPAARRRVLWPALAIAAGTGFCGLAYEVLWTRALLTAFAEGTTYVFSMMLGVFLAGHALGSALACRKRYEPGDDDRDGAASDWRRLGSAQAGAGLSAILTLPLLVVVQGWLDQAVLVGDDATFWGLLVPFHLAGCLVLVFVPAAFLGASFPITARLYVGGGGADRCGASAGRLYAANTAGAIAGAIAAAACLVPAIGTQASIVALAALQTFQGIVATVAGGGRRGRPARLLTSVALVLVATAAVGLNGLFTLGSVYARKERGRMVDLVEAAGATVTVHDRGTGDRVININGANVAGTSHVLQTTQKLQAHLPLLLHEAPRAVLQVGFGSGGTCRSISLHREVTSIDVAELTTEVISLSRTWFPEIHRGVLDDPRVRVHIVDARSFMAVTGQAFDLILSDSIHPRFRGNAALYSRDYFALCAAHLRPGGIVSTWLPLYGMSCDDLRTVLASMRSVFPHVQVWYPSSETNENTVILGSMAPLSLRWPSLVARMAEPAVAGDLAEVGIRGPMQLLDCFLMGDRGVAAMTAGRPVNTDDRPRLEFLAPRTFHRVRAWGSNFDLLRSGREPLGEALAGAGPDVRDCYARWYRATGYKLAAQSCEIAVRLPDAFRNYARCVSENPEDADAAARLARLRLAFPEIFRESGAGAGPVSMRAGCRAPAAWGEKASRRRRETAAARRGGHRETLSVSAEAT